MAGTVISEAAKACILEMKTETLQQVSGGEMTIAHSKLNPSFSDFMKKNNKNKNK